MALITLLALEVALCGTEHGTGFLSLRIDSSSGQTTWCEQVGGGDSVKYFVCERQANGVKRREVSREPVYVVPGGGYLTVDRGREELQRCSLFSGDDRLIGSVRSLHGVAYVRGTWTYSLQAQKDSYAIARTQFLKDNETKTFVVAGGIAASEDATRICASLDGRVVAWWNERHADCAYWIRDGRTRSFDHDWPIESCALSKSGDVIYVLVRNDQDRVISIDTKTGKTLTEKTFAYRSVPALSEDDGSEGILIPGSVDVGFAGLFSPLLEFVKKFELE